MEKTRIHKDIIIIGAGMAGLTAALYAGRMNMDVAYQYSATNGEFSPFMSYVDNDTPADDNIANSVSVSNKRHQLLFTLGYTF